MAKLPYLAYLAELDTRDLHPLGERATGCLVAGPYLLCIARHWPDALGQTAFIKGEWAALGLPALVDNVRQEPVRYRLLLQPGEVAAAWDDPWYGRISLRAVGEECRSAGSRSLTIVREVQESRTRRTA